MNRHARRKEAASAIQVYCKSCRAIIVQVRLRGRSAADFMADPKTRALFDAHRAKSGCPEILADLAPVPESAKVGP